MGGIPPIIRCVRNCCCNPATLWVHNFWRAVAWMSNMLMTSVMATRQLQHGVDDIMTSTSTILSITSWRPSHQLYCRWHHGVHINYNVDDVNSIWRWWRQHQVHGVNAIDVYVCRHWRHDADGWRHGIKDNKHVRGRHLHYGARQHDTLMPCLHLCNWHRRYWHNGVVNVINNMSATSTSFLFVRFRCK